MSLDGLMGGLQITGIGFQQYSNGDAIIGYVIPQDVAVAVKYKALFFAYLDTSKNNLHTLLKNVQSAGFTVKECDLSQRVTIFDGIPAYGVWQCYKIIANQNNVNSDLKLIVGDLVIPTKF